MRTVNVKLTVNAILLVDEDAELSEVINESTIFMRDDSDRMDVIDMSVENWEVADSK
jgi:hypothetical protein